MAYDHWNGETEDRGGYSYDPYARYHERRRKLKRRRTGLLVVLIVLAMITGLVSWAVNFMELQVERDEDSVTLSIGDPEMPVEETNVPEETAPPTPPVQTEQGSALGISDTPRSVENRPAEDEKARSLQQIYEKVSPSVASISCVTAGGVSTGTGIVMSQDGYVITNYHVIEKAQQIFVMLGEDDQYSAVLVGGDEITDLAVLKVDAYGLSAAEFGDSDMLRVGDVVVAIGDPLGTQLRGTMTDGIVSAINRDLDLSGRRMTLIQTNAALNSGNSGGPLIN